MVFPSMRINMHRHLRIKSSQHWNLTWDLSSLTHGRPWHPECVHCMHQTGLFVVWLAKHTFRRVQRKYTICRVHVCEWTSSDLRRKPVIVGWTRRWVRGVIFFSGSVRGEETWRKWFPQFHNETELHLRLDGWVAQTWVIFSGFRRSKSSERWKIHVSGWKDHRNPDFCVTAFAAWKWARG